MKSVRISDLKSHLSAHVRAVEHGETIEVTDRARPIARVVPVEREGILEIVPAARPFASIRKLRVAPARLSMSSLEALLHVRGSR
jgi:prevent-host-death family protein